MLYYMLPTYPVPIPGNTTKQQRQLSVIQPSSENSMMHHIHINTIFKSPKINLQRHKRNCAFQWNKHTKTQQTNTNMSSTGSTQWNLFTDFLNQMYCCIIYNYYIYCTYHYVENNSNTSESIAHLFFPRSKFKSFVIINIDYKIKRPQWKFVIESFIRWNWWKRNFNFLEILPSALPS